VIDGNGGTTEPSWNPTNVLGLELERIRDKRAICVRMTKKIDEMAGAFFPEGVRNRHQPMTAASYVVKDTDYEGLVGEEALRAEFLGAKGISRYLSLIGGLLWICGIRFDVTFAVMYLTWYSHLPRQHHIDVGLRLLEFLAATKDIPLVLGGRGKFEVVTQTDASHGTGPKCRGIIAEFTRISEGAGAVNAKATATDTIHLSSFEVEGMGTIQAYDEQEIVAKKIKGFDLQGTTNAFKTTARVVNELTELEYPVAGDYPRTILGDNEKAITFIRSETEGKNVRHADLRLWYVRGQIRHSRVDYRWHQGTLLNVNAMTKVVNLQEQARFTWDIMGHALLGVKEPTVDEKPKAVKKPKVPTVNATGRVQGAD
jgi:hypothetical protein